MGREERTGSRETAPPQPIRKDGRPRYGDRFRPERFGTEQFATERPGPHGSPSAVARAQRASGAPPSGMSAPGERVSPAGDLVATEVPARRWPRWATRGAAGIGVVATAVLAITFGDGGAASDGDGDPAPSATPINDAPPAAPFDVVLAETDIWASRGFSYEITLTNRSELTYVLLDVGPKMSGTELAFDRTLVLQPGKDTTVRVDYLVLNCLAATTSSAPKQVRMVVREAGTVTKTALAQVPTSALAERIDASGDDICAGPGGGNFSGSVLG